jgi:hypothetical protein
MVFVIRDKKILMEKIFYNNRFFYTIPGGGIEEDNQPIKDVCWMELEQLSERDRAFMWSYGLMEIDGFFDEILRWGDSISYPLYH